VKLQQFANSHETNTGIDWSGVELVFQGKSLDEIKYQHKKLQGEQEKWTEKEVETIKQLVRESVPLM